MPRVAAGWAAAAVGLTVGACFSKPGPPNEQTPDDARLDARRDDDAMVTPAEDAGVDAAVDPAVCTLYDFNAGVGCGGWGTIDVGDASIGNGTLVLTVPASGTEAAARCISPQRPISRATLSVASLPDLKTHRVTLYADVMGQRTSLELYENGGSKTVLATCKGTLHATGFMVPLEWLRIIETGAGVVMQVSANGTAWVTLGSTCSVVLSSAVLGLEVTRQDAGVQASSAGFESLELCR